MRLLTFIAAIGIVLLGGYEVVIHGYPHFLRTTSSQLAAQLMTIVSALSITIFVFWAVKKLP